MMVYAGRTVLECNKLSRFFSLSILSQLHSGYWTLLTLSFKHVHSLDFCKLSFKQMVCIFKHLSPPVCPDPIYMIICDKQPSYLPEMLMVGQFSFGQLPCIVKTLVIQGTLKTDIKLGLHVSEIYLKTKVKLV